MEDETWVRSGAQTTSSTGTARMRLVEQGKGDLAAPARTYLPDLLLADEAAAKSVTVRQLLNHSAGWWADDFLDPVPGDAAIAR